jgi:hypothetical protein
MKLRVSTLVCLAVLLIACAAVTPVQPAPEITASQTTPTAASATATPRAAAAPSPTATTLSATPTSALPGGCAPFRRQMELYGCVVKFTVEPGQVAAGAAVTFTWEVTGTNRVGLELYHFQGVAAGPGFRSWDNLPLTGSLSVQLSDLDTGVYPVRLWADDPSAGGYAYGSIAYACFDPFFVGHGSPPAGSLCQGGAAVSTHAIQQDFEHGRMIWLQSEESIYILFERDSGVVPAEWTIPDVKDGSQPATLQSFTPPTGKYQPQAQFGRIWERYDLLKTLGWALTPEQRFTSVAQRGSNLRLPLYFRLADERVVYLVDNPNFSRMLTPYWSYLLP